MLIEVLIQHAKQLKKPLLENQFIAISELPVHHADFFLVNFLIYYLKNTQKEINFIACRENYAHYQSICKKMGFSLQPSLKNKRINYYQAFQADFCSQLPLCQSSPSCYQLPPNTVKKINSKQIGEIRFKENSIVIIDSISFLEYDESNSEAKNLLLIYQETLRKQCSLIAGGFVNRTSKSNEKQIDFQKIIFNQADTKIMMQQDVGGVGKFEVIWTSNDNWQDKKSLELHWKFGQGAYQVSRHVVF